MITLVPENYLHLFNQMSTLQRKKQTQWISSIAVHIINLDQNRSHLFIQVHHADALRKPYLYLS